MAFQFFKEYAEKPTTNYPHKALVEVFDKAYTNLMIELYSKSYGEEMAKSMVNDFITHGSPMNISTDKYDGKVLSSIKSDVAILETIDKILTLMFTCNQYLVQTPMHNLYAQDK
jgi:hypothetical protein